MSNFILKSSYSPSGDQPNAINSLVKGIENNEKYQTLEGVTGSGKTFTVANVISKVKRPSLVLAHNKTLAAQLYTELKEYFLNTNIDNAYIKKVAFQYFNNDYDCARNFLVSLQEQNDRIIDQKSLF